MRVLVVLVLCLSGCQPEPTPEHFTADAYPDALSAWGMLRASQSTLTLTPHSAVYALNAPLFSDYAHKLRTLFVPTARTGRYADFEALDLPVGTIISKTFFYLRGDDGLIDTRAAWSGDPADIDPERLHLVETRLLVRQADGWDALPYIWKGDDAYLAISGALLKLKLNDGQTLNYLVPSRNQCASCHATDHTDGSLQPIGIKARHLQRADPVHGKPQLPAWQARGWIADLPGESEIPANASIDDASASLDHRARSYLDINCGHCHNPTGPADTSGLLLDYQAHPMAALGACKPPIASGRGSGGFLYGIVPGKADESIMTFRMRTRDPATMMPEIGRSLVDAEGLDLISRWIDSLPGECS